MDVARKALQTARDYLLACMVYGNCPTPENEAECERARDAAIEALEELRKTEDKDVQP